MGKKTKRVEMDHGNGAGGWGVVSDSFSLFLSPLPLCDLVFFHSTLGREKCGSCVPLLFLHTLISLSRTRAHSLTAFKHPPKHNAEHRSRGRMHSAHSSSASHYCVLTHAAFLRPSGLERKEGSNRKLWLMVACRTALCVCVIVRKPV